MGLGQALLP